MLTIKNCIRIFFQLILPIFGFCAGLPYGNRHHFIENPTMSRWGEWGTLEKCASDQVVVGMRLKVHENQGVKDDTGLNGVTFYCKNPYSSSEYAQDIVAITSLVGNNGEWKQKFFCPSVPGGSAENNLIAVGFQLRSEPSTGVKDDTAGNNLRLVCSDLYQKNGYNYLEGDGTQRGEWTERQLCWPGYAICGLQTQVEVSRSIDTTGLNNMKVRCCKIDSEYHLQMANNASNSNHDASVEGNSSSSSENSDEIASVSEEKDGRGEDNHSPHRDDHGLSVEDFVEKAETRDIMNTEVRGSPEEQELVAIVDPEPTEEIDLSLSIESSIFTNRTMTDRQEQESHPTLLNPSREDSHTVSNEDENLPEEIAQIDQVDNSEAHHEEEENVSTVTDSNKHVIPEEVVNALEDVDSAGSSFDNDNGNDHHHVYSFHNNNKEFQWGTEVTNLKDLSDIANSTDLDEATNSIDEEPKSSPMFGKIGANTTILSVQSHGHNISCNWRSFAVVSLIVILCSM